MEHRVKRDIAKSEKTDFIPGSFSSLDDKAYLTRASTKLENTKQLDSASRGKRNVMLGYLTLSRYGYLRATPR